VASSSGQPFAQKSSSNLEKREFLDKIFWGFFEFPPTSPHPTHSIWVSVESLAQDGSNDTSNPSIGPQGHSQIQRRPSWDECSRKGGSQPTPSPFQRGPNSTSPKDPPPIGLQIISIGPYPQVNPSPPNLEISLKVDIFQLLF